MIFTTDLDYSYQGHLQHERVKVLYGIHALFFVCFFVSVFFNLKSFLFIANLKTDKMSNIILHAKK